MVPAVIIPTFWHEIAMLKELGAVFLQEELDRFCARLVQTHVDIANAV
jgi:hypothetical protein